jgi:uncharacterized phage-associated protein
MNEKDILKIKAVLLYLLNKFDKEIDYITVFKLLYLSQKRHLKEYGIPMFKDEFYAFKAGPAPSIIYSLCKIADGEVKENSNILKELKYYSDFLFVITKEKKNGTVIKYIKTDVKPEINRLSKSNIKVLNEIFEKYSRYSPSKLSTISHDKAWEKYWDEGNKTPNKIPTIEIAKAARPSKSLLQYVSNSVSMCGL